MTMDVVVAIVAASVLFCLIHYAFVKFAKKMAEEDEKNFIERTDD